MSNSETLMTSSESGESLFFRALSAIRVWSTGYFVCIFKTEIMEYGNYMAIIK